MFCIYIYLNVEQDGELFTSVLYNLYVAPEGFCFDAFCNDDPILDNPKLHGYNVNAKVIILIHLESVFSDINN